MKLLRICSIAIIYLVCLSSSILPISTSAMQPAETESAHDTAAEAAPTEFPGFRQVTALAEAYPDTIERWRSETRNGPYT